MTLSDYFGGRPNPLFFARPERILYGTDFPNLPYAWDRELRRLGDHGVKDHDLPAILGDNAKRLFGIVV
jgi:predicted TIM-barrel fold metal-dependent hydrolase